MKYEFRWYCLPTETVYRLQYRRVSADGTVGEDWQIVPYVK